eukprot:scaffold100250_cov20-Phaeocystis_antarctica.AAC.1
MPLVPRHVESKAAQPSASWRSGGFFRAPERASGCPGASASLGPLAARAALTLAGRFGPNL